MTIISNERTTSHSHSDDKDDTTSSSSSSSSSSSITTSPPQHFVCPMTLEIMSQPFLHRTSGHNFERDSILEWMYLGNATCPLTRRPLHPDDFTLNTELQQEIQQWKQLHNCQQDDDDDDDDHEEEMEPVSEQDHGDLYQVEKNHPSSVYLGLSKTRVSRILSVRNRVLQQRDQRLRNFR